MKKVKLLSGLVVTLFVSSSLAAQQDMIGIFNLPTSQKEARQLEEAAERGDAESQYLLGIAFYYGGYLPKDGESSAEWLLKSAESGNQRAILALLQFAAKVSPETKKRIKDWLAYDQMKKAAQAGILPRE